MRCALPITALLVWLVLALVPGVRLAAQEDAGGDDPAGVDALFDAPAGSTGESSGSADPGDDGDERDEGDESAPSGTVLDELLEPDPLSVRADMRVAVGYSGGWTADGDGLGAYDQLPLIALASGLDLSVTFSSILSLSQSMRVTWPDYELAVTKLVIDYTVADLAFVTAGLTNVVWGRSPTYPHTNLPGRRAANPLSAPATTGAMVVRTRIPIGVGGLEMLLQNRAEYQPAPSTPGVEYLGVGVAYNLALESFDLDTGAYYQRGMPGRAFLAVATTLTDRIELYAEGSVSDERLRVDDTGPVLTVPANNPDFGASVGAVVSLFDGNADLNLEYFYNGEEGAATVSGSRFPLLWGHNMALNLDTDFGGSSLRLRAGVRHNPSLGSGVIAPVLTWRPGSHLAIDLTGAWIWGDANRGYATANPDPLDRSLVLAGTVTVSGRM